MMPGSIKKDLYISKSLKDLNAMSADIPKVTSARMFVKSAEKVFSNAEQSYLNGDEERSYILYMKYFNIVTGIKKTSEYKKTQKYFDDMIGAKNLNQAINRAEDLAASLKSRYEELEAVEVSEKLDMLRVDTEKKLDEIKDSTPQNIPTTVPPNNASDTKTERDIKNSIDPTVPPGGIGVHTAYRLLNSLDVTVVLMDVRSRESYEESHIKNTAAINIPADIIQPGMTVYHIEAKVPAESMTAWKNRGNTDYVILVDWRCSARNIQPRTSLASLKDAIFKWDQDTILRHEPLVLEGGYEEWLLCYPAHTTNASVTCPLPSTNTLDQAPSLDSIEYDLDFLQSPKPSPPRPDTSTPHGVPQDGVVPIPLMPSFDRSTKPRLNVGSLNNTTDSTFSGSDVKANVSTIRNRLTDVTVPTDPPSRTGVPGKNTNITGRGTTVSQLLPDRASKPANSSRTEPRDDSPPPDYNESTGRDVTAGQTARLNKDRQELLAIQQLKKKEAEELANLMRQKKKVSDEMKAVRQRKRDADMRSSNGSVPALATRPDTHTTPALTGRPDTPTSSEESENELDKMATEGIDRRTREIFEERQRTTTTGNNSTLADGAKTNNSTTHRDVADDTNSVEKEATKPDEELKEAKRLQAELLAKQQEIESSKATFEAAQRDKQRVAAEENERRKLEEKKRSDATELAKREQAKQELEKKQEAEKREKAKRDDEKRQAAERQEETRRLEETRHLEEARRLEDARRLKEEEVHKEAAKRELADKPSIDDGDRSSLPVGWERRLDSKTGKYYYIDHATKKTFWTLPYEQTADADRTSYRTPLKDGPSSGGLKRSHSSPNIAKLLEDETSRSALRQPHIDRTIKPPPTNVDSRIALQTQVSAAKVRNLQPTWGSVRCGLTGLRNLGNTCYMNSTIQCLSSTVPLTMYFLSDSYINDINRENRDGFQGHVADEYAVLIKALWSGQYRAVSPRDVRSLASQMDSRFATSQHQDSQELLEKWMNGLNEDLNKVKRKPQLAPQNNDRMADDTAAEFVWRESKRAEDSIIVDLFRGQFKSTVTCLKCNKKSVMFESFMCLSLPIPSATRCTLADCMLHFSKEERLAGDSQYLCTNCNCMRDAVKRIVIWRLPPILIVHFKRFYYQDIWRDKITTDIDFPLEGLDMSRYISGPVQRPPYKLFAVSNHFGTLDGGHYTASCANNSTWYKFDDQEVYETSKSSIKSPAAYMLFYTSMKIDRM